MTRPAVFTQSDVAKLLKGARSAGYKVSRVEIDPNGKIVAQLSQDDALLEASSGDEWEITINAKKERAPKERH